MNFFVLLFFIFILLSLLFFSFLFFVNLFFLLNAYSSVVRGEVDYWMPLIYFVYLVPVFFMPAAADSSPGHHQLFPRAFPRA